MLHLRIKLVASEEWDGTDINSGFEAAHHRASIRMREVEHAHAECEQGSSTILATILEVDGSEVPEHYRVAMLEHCHLAAVVLREH